MRLNISLPAVALVASFAASAGNVEILHWWTSPGEKESLAVLEQMLRQQGHTLKSVAVDQQTAAEPERALENLLMAGRAPTAAQLKKSQLGQWAEIGMLQSMNSLALEEKWRDLLFPELIDIASIDGEMVSVPLNVHRINWLWLNSAALVRLGVREPETLDDLFIIAERARKAGITPLVMGNEPWEKLTLFEYVAAAELGSKDYVKIFVKRDPEALAGTKLKRVFATFGKLRDLARPNLTSSWSEATQQVVDGSALMQLSGDWAKAEFVRQGKVPGIDFVCALAPGSQKQFIYTVDSLAMFRLANPASQEAQRALARTLVSPQFQHQFNQSKGSMPIRRDMRNSRFDRCTEKAMKDFNDMGYSEDLLPSLAHGMALSPRTRDELTRIVNAYFDNPQSMPDFAAALVREELSR